MDLNGVWYNEFPSVMEIDVRNGVIKGTYQSKVGDVNGRYLLSGFVDNHVANNAAISWIVMWSNEKGNLHSTTAWTGEVQQGEDGAITIETTWILTSETTVGDDWKSTLIGKDTFTREISENAEVPRKIPSHPLK